MGDAARGFHARKSRGAKVIAGTVDRGRGLLRPLERHGGRDVQCLETWIVGRIDRLGVRNGRTEIRTGQFLAHVGDAVQCIAHRALAGGVQVRIETGLDRLQHQRIEHLRREVQLAQVLARRPLRRLVGTAVVQVRGQHGAGVRRGVDDAVHEQFDVAHVHARCDLHLTLVVGAGQGLGLGDGFHRVGGRGGRVQLDRQQGPGGQFAGLLQAGEGLAVFRPRQRIEETGDALLAHGVEGRAHLIEFFRVGRRRHHGGQ
ncbi:hypothetical protein D3C81_1286460 [compost metagenome]